MRQQRRIGRDHDDARALVVLLGHEVGQVPTDRHAVDPQLCALAVVRQHEHARP